MRVYHGSYTKVEKIDLSLCRPFRDFGRGFYVTKLRRHAESWAANVGRRHNAQGVVSEFEYRENAFTQHICRIKRFEAYNEEWLDFVVVNRNENNAAPAHSYDIVEGPVADDKVQNRISEYLTGKVSKADFLKELTYHEETHQICFCTLNSLQTIDCINDTPRSEVTTISEPLLEVLMTDNSLNEVEATDLFFSSDTFAQLSNSATGLYKKSWQEIYEMLKAEQQRK